MNTPILVRATPADLDLLLELNAEYCAADGHECDRDVARSGFGPLLEDDGHGAVWLVHPSADRPADGYVVVAWSWSVEVGGAEAVLDELYVRTSGRGTGGRVVDAVIDECRRRGMQRVVLETERHNEAARRLYTRCGFVADDSIWMSHLLLPPHPPAHPSA